jgi:hypothetical protein
MRNEWKAWITAAALAAASPALEAQAPAAADTKSSQSNAQSEAGEPRATTSPDAATPNDSGASEAAPASSASQTSSRTPASGPGSHSRAATPAAAKSGPVGANPSGKPGGVDRLELGTATVTGDREQPKVMYIVPWKRSDIGDLSGKPMNSLLDEALAPIDREEFKRQVVYYQAVRADAAQNGAAKTPPQGEK